MKTRPILFSAPMVRALLDGTKTQTRRVLRHQPTARHQLYTVTHGGSMVVAAKWIPNTGDDGPNAVLCPYGSAGDRLWVREAWRVGKAHDERSPVEVVQRIGYPDMRAFPHGLGVTVLYQAGGWKSIAPLGRTGDPVYPDDMPMPEWAGKLRPSIHMPRVFSRLTLEVVDVRVERLQDISEADAMAEGLAERTLIKTGIHAWEARAPLTAYRSLWEQINGFGAWTANPFVWCVSFKRVEA